MPVGHFPEFLRGLAPVSYTHLDVYKRQPKIGALLLECSNLATYGYEISKQFALPVFDIGTAIIFLHHGICKTNYRP